METRAREAWRETLGSWALPPSLYEAAGEEPRSLLPGRTTPGNGTDDEPSHTAQAITELLGPGGSVLDIGTETGTLVAALASRGYRVTAVVSGNEAAEQLAREVDRLAVSVTRIVGRWPDVAGNTGHNDVSVSAHTAFDVPALGPFVEEMHRRARRGVVLEATARHPWASLARYVQLLHGIDLPRRPTIDLLIDVVREVTGVEPHAHWWSAPPSDRFADMRDLLAHYRRLLLVPPERSIEAAGYLEPDVVELDDGSLALGSRERELVTLWWRVA